MFKGFPIKYGVIILYKVLWINCWESDCIPGQSNNKDYQSFSTFVPSIFATFSLWAVTSNHISTCWISATLKQQFQTSWGSDSLKSLKDSRNAECWAPLVNFVIQSSGMRICLPSKFTDDTASQGPLETTNVEPGSSLLMFSWVCLAHQQISVSI